MDPDNLYDGEDHEGGVAVLEAPEERVVPEYNKDDLIEMETKSVIRVLKKYGGARNDAGAEAWIGIPIKDFVTECFKQHEALIKRWGGWRYHAVPYAEERCDAYALDDITYKIDYTVARLAEIRDLMSPIGMPTMSMPLPRIHASTDFASRFWPKPDGTISISAVDMVSIRRGQSVSRAVLAYVRKKYKKYPHYVSVWERMFELLGHAWKSRKPLAITFSVAPSSYLRMGHYGENSCYGFGKEQAKSKKYLATMPNTFVTLAYDEGAFKEPKVNGKGRVGKPVHRNWGMLVPGRGIITSNHYIYPVETVYPMILQCASDAFDLGFLTFAKDVKAVFGNPFQHFTTFGYTNGDAVAAVVEGETTRSISEAVDAVARGYRNAAPF